MFVLRVWIVLISARFFSVWDVFLFPASRPSCDNVVSSVWAFCLRFPWARSRLGCLRPPAIFSELAGIACPREHANPIQSHCSLFVFVSAAGWRCFLFVLRVLAGVSCSISQPFCFCSYCCRCLGNFDWFAFFVSRPAVLCYVCLCFVSGFVCFRVFFTRLGYFRVSRL